MALSREKVYDVYGWFNMKKNENISFRTDKDTKEILSEVAQSKKWSISLLVEDIIQQWIEENQLRQKSDS